MSERERLGGWLDGPGPAADPGQYRGERLGLPQDGPGSVATASRRAGALLIDWLACTVIALAIFHSRNWTLLVFGIEDYLLTALTGFTLGKRLTGIRAIRLDGRPVGLLWGLVRTVLLLAVVPPLVYDRDLRGLHDRAANTVVVRAGALSPRG